MDLTRSTTVRPETEIERDKRPRIDWVLYRDVGEPVAVAVGWRIVGVVVVVVEEGSPTAGVRLDVFFGASGIHKRWRTGSLVTVEGKQETSRPVTDGGVTGVKPPDVKVLGNLRFFVPAWSSERLVTRLQLM
ncbi:hypothetical protein DICSQDRAFT_172395 [Dichomitus squalens LYAD-421 SS1]|uniref:Uncharacterized protein n=1 Tax=Dichomitus squalens (strain LYAD-421) TaxID=732165 RepID=R7STK2_DICSQ|nr:uncharacterized protein DICSQDRAFT_172395 [Dichomitus squalens LYAD-421 SS1]EJF59075.1 hypothetical protein DICSQDRAFT_172395 [Dichomitus squalens LYAD-421 SS1]